MKKKIRNNLQKSKRDFVYLTFHVSFSYPGFLCKYSSGVQKHSYNFNSLAGFTTQIGVLFVSYLFYYISLFCKLLDNSCEIILVSGPDFVTIKSE